MRVLDWGIIVEGKRKKWRNDGRKKKRRDRAREEGRKRGRGT